MNRTDFLFSTPSFLRGIAKILDIHGISSNIYNGSSSSAKADYEAISSDWKMVGKDMREALDEYKKEINKGTYTK